MALDLPPAAISMLGAKNEEPPRCWALVSGPSTQSERTRALHQGVLRGGPGGSTRECIPPPLIEAQPGRAVPARQDASAAATVAITCRGSPQFIVASPRGQTARMGNKQPSRCRHSLTQYFFVLLGFVPILVQATRRRLAGVSSKYWALRAHVATGTWDLAPAWF